MAEGKISKTNVQNREKYRVYGYCPKCDKDEMTMVKQVPGQMVWKCPHCEYAVPTRTRGSLELVRKKLK